MKIVKKYITVTTVKIQHIVGEDEKKFTVFKHCEGLNCQSSYSAFLQRKDRSLT